MIDAEEDGAMLDTTYAIHSNPEIMGGTPVFVGTRVPLQNLLDYLVGSGLEEFLRQFPTVSREQAVRVIEEKLLWRDTV
jgi:uncharacterized protein (DUF433 family)